MPRLGLEPTISAGERPQTYTLRLLGHWDVTDYTYNLCNSPIIKETETHTTLDAEKHTGNLRQDGTNFNYKSGTL